MITAEKDARFMRRFIFSCARAADTSTSRTSSRSKRRGHLTERKPPGQSIVNSLIGRERRDGFQDEVGDFIGLRHHGHVATCQSQRCRPHPPGRVALNR